MTASAGCSVRFQTPRDGHQHGVRLFCGETDANNRVTDVRIAYGGVAATPVRALKTEAALRGQPWTAETITKLKPVLMGEFTPISDVRGTKEYRVQMITGLLEKFFHGAMTRGEAQTRFTRNAR